MNRILLATAIYTDFVSTIEEAQAELQGRGWSVGHIAIDGGSPVLYFTHK